jgi:hypothetical protein
MGSPSLGGINVYCKIGYLEWGNMCCEVSLKFKYLGKFKNIFETALGHESEEQAI